MERNAVEIGEGKAAGSEESEAVESEVRKTVGSEEGNEMEKWKKIRT
jgi:hypothetical protein